MHRALVGIAVLSTVSLGLGGAVTASGGPATASAKCDPVSTKAHFQKVVPRPQHVLGFPLGSREATNDEIGKYWKVVDRATDRVVTGVFAHSPEGRPLRYALVGSTRTMHRLPAVRRDIARLGDPATPRQDVAALLEHTPTVLWIAANVHGNEPSGGDAVLELLYNLADRDDCVAAAIRSNALVGLIPVQNPDGREHHERANGYAFDLNRDWFARTQPETAGKLDLLWKYQPQVFVDEHEMGGTSYFFPPNADPVYAETAEPIYDEIANRYGGANAAAFDAEGWRYETYQSGYDLFYQGYGDTVPTTEFGAAGMTYEQGDVAPYPERVEHHFTSALVTLYTGATNRESVLRQWRASFVHAEAEGARCKLEKNITYNPGHEVQRQVPDRPVCGYFLPGNSAATRLVVRRLQLAHVVVDRLDADTGVPDYKPYGRPARQTTMPAGTYWVTLDQPQKHWVQAMLNENTYVPFPYFYDVSGWSTPLLAGIRGGSSGTPLSTPVTRVSLLPQPRDSASRAGQPKVAVLDQFAQTYDDYSTTGWLKWRLDHDWDLPYTSLQPSQVTASALQDIDVLVVPNLDASPVYQELGDAGRKAIQDWVRAGGRYVGWQEGALLASSLDLSTVGLGDPQATSPGALMRIPTPHGPNEIMWDSDYGLQMTPGDARVIAAFPHHMFVSGYAQDAGTLAGTPAEAVDDVGAGSVTVFGYEPNFRAFSDGSARMLRDAILHTPAGSVPANAQSAGAPVYTGVPALRLAPRSGLRHEYDARGHP
jgi:hypothetical protein